jgi:hypothetical protein
MIQISLQVFLQENGMKKKRFVPLKASSHNSRTGTAA